jgi:WhiB family redox-sensing transcriptional regulator
MYWRERAACRGVDTELFFPIGNSGPATLAQIDEAKAVCGRCPVVEQCLKWATEGGEVGIWGGMTDSERCDIRRRGARQDRDTVATTR